MLNLKSSIPELNALLIKGEIHPMDLVNELERTVQLYEPIVHAWVNLDIESVKSETKNKSEGILALTKRSALAGLPVGVKDIFNTRQFPTEMGSPVWKGFTPGNNARAVDALLDEGAIIAGKTVTAEFAVHELNKTQNPHDITRTPGTSSSGSAVAVATGMVPYALGTQTAGSIVRPASFCGIWGMKPSFGLIPRTGILKTTDSLDTVGFLASHGESLFPILDALRVKGPDYPFVYQNMDRKITEHRKKKESWRIGFVRTHTWRGAEGYAKEAMEGFVNTLANTKFVEMNQIEWSGILAESHEIHKTIYNKSLSYYFQAEEKAGEQVSKIMREMIEKGKSISPEEYKSALSAQVEIRQTLDSLLQSYDAVISLATSSDAPVRGVQELPDPSLIWTLAQIPTVAIPMFRSPAGLPFGIQMVAKKWSDFRLLTVIEDLIERGVLPSGSQEIRNIV